MDGWIGGSEIVSRLGYKILIAGLSEAGKTAVKRIFFLKQQTGDVDKLAATVDYERMAVSIADVPITIVDLGGQRVFINRFLNNFSPFVFSSVKIFIFVIDVAVKSSKNNAIQYFASCVNRLKQYSPETEFFVFLHKNDLVINQPNYESIHAQLKEQFQHECPQRILFFRTTIFRPETVIDAFGRIFELTIPELARSEYVNGRIINQGEEFAEKYAALELQDACCPKCGNTFVDIGKDGLLCNFCGFRRSLGQISSQRESNVPVSEFQSRSDEKEKSIGSPTIRTDLPEELATSGKASDSSAIDKLQALLDEALIKDAPKVGQTSSEVQKTPLTYLRDAAIEETGEKFALSSHSEGKDSDDSSIDLQTTFLAKFYGIKTEEAIILIEGNHDKLFETAAQAGVPVSLLLNVFLKYVPYMQNRDLIVQNFDDKLMDIFFAYLNKQIKEEEIFDCLIFIAKEPEKSIIDIIDSHLLKKREEKQKEEMEPIKPIERIIRDLTPSETTGELEIFPLSEEEDIGFQIEKIGSNCRLIFYQGNHRLGSNLIPKFTSKRELRYFLTFEAKLPVNDINSFVERAVPIIQKSIEDIFTSKKTEEIDELPLDGEKMIKSHIIPLLKDYEVFFEVVMSSKQITIEFTILGRNIGRVKVPVNVKALDLLENMRDKTLLLAIIPEDELLFATQAVYSEIEILMRKLEDRS
ncbi:MAG: ADP-ribosylation factor-like protein [Candidatus Hodarchaeales archaeon]